MKPRHDQALGCGVGFTFMMESSKGMAFYFWSYSLRSAHTLTSSQSLTQQSRPGSGYQYDFWAVLSQFPSRSWCSAKGSSKRERRVSSGLWASGWGKFPSERQHKWEALTSYIKYTLAPVYIPMRTTARTAAFMPVEGTELVVSREHEAGSPKPWLTACVCFCFLVGCDCDTSTSRISTGNTNNWKPGNPAYWVHLSVGLTLEKEPGIFLVRSITHQLSVAFPFLRLARGWLKLPAP